jgi:hypothetical protein
MLAFAILAGLGAVSAVVGHSPIAPAYAEQTGNGGGD